MKTIAGSMMAMALMLSAAPAFAGDKDSAASQNVPVYNVKSEAEFKGVIATMNQVADGKAYAGIHLSIQTKTDLVEVFLQE